MNTLKRMTIIAFLIFRLGPTAGKVWRIGVMGTKKEIIQAAQKRNQLNKTFSIKTIRIKFRNLYSNEKIMKIKINYSISFLKILNDRKINITVFVVYRRLLIY